MEILAEFGKMGNRRGRPGKIKGTIACTPNFNSYHGHSDGLKFARIVRKITPIQEILRTAKRLEEGYRV